MNDSSKQGGRVGIAESQNMAALGGNVGVGGPGNSMLTRNLERVLEEASLSGELRLSGRKLREFPKGAAAKFNLSDTVYADLSKNRLTEFPVEITEYESLEKLTLYHNVIRTIPDTVAFLQSLTYLDLSRNQLSVLPSCLSQLPLQVLIVSHNRLVSLPEELGRMKTLLELDATSNQLAHVPPQLGDLYSLRSLSLRKNCLVELPKEITFLRLTNLDIAENRVTTLPVELRFMTSLEEFAVEHNPLTSPPAYLCTRGRVHVFKYLEIQALKEDKKRGVLDQEARRSHKKSVPLSDFRCPVNGDPRRKRFTVDSGYNTCDGTERRWSQDSHDTSNDSEEGRRLALRAAEMLKETRLTNGFDSHHSPAPLVNGHGNGCVTPVQHSPAERGRVEPEKSRSHHQQPQQHRFTPDEDEEGEEEREERRRAARKIIEQQKEETRKRSEAAMMRQAQETEAERLNDDKRPVHMQTYREYKEALRQQRGDVYRPRTSGDNSPVLTPNQDHPLSRTSSLSPVAYPPFNGHPLVQNPEPFVKALQKEAVLTYVKSKTSPVVGSHIPVAFHEQDAPWNANVNGSSGKQSLAPRVSNSSTTSSNGTSTNHATSPLTATTPVSGPRQRHLPQTPPGPSSREQELLQQLRSSIESRLKVSLPEDLGSALLDGVVLCHLANHVQPRAVASIHVPSPAVPKLTLAKCRRNVENFIEACRRIGVPEKCVARVLLEDDQEGGATAGLRLEPLRDTIQTLLTLGQDSPLAYSSATQTGAPSAHFTLDYPKRTPSLNPSSFCSTPLPVITAQDRLIANACLVFFLGTLFLLTWLRAQGVEL